MHVFRRFTLTAVLVAATSAAAAAQAPLSLTLDEALARGVEQSPRLAEARARQAAASAVVDGRRALGRPLVSTTAGWVRTNHVDEFGVVQPDGAFRVIFPDIPSNYRLRAEAAIPLYTAGRVDALVASATADLRAAEADRLGFEQDVRLEVSRAYWSLVSGREAVGVMEQALARMDAWVSDVRSRVEAGVLPPNDVLSAEAERARQSVRLVRARHDADLAEVVLARLIGVGPDQRIEPVSVPSVPLEGVATAIDRPVPALVQEARDGRAERLGLEERAVGLRAAADAALAALRPQVSALLAVEPARPNSRFVPRSDEWQTSWDLGVNVSWPVWDGGRAQSEQAAALAQAEAVGHRIRELDAALSVEVRSRVLALDADRAALDAAERAVAAAAEAHRVVTERFDAGVATSTDVLDAQLALLEAELERTQLQAAQRIHEAEFMRTLGAG